MQSTSSRLGTDCGSDPELVIAKFRLKLKKAGKTDRPFKYDLNQIPYDYTAEVLAVGRAGQVPQEVGDEHTCPEQGWGLRGPCRPLSQSSSPSLGPQVGMLARPAPPPGH